MVQVTCDAARRRLAIELIISKILRCCVREQGNFRLHQYQVCGRHLPSEKEPEPTVFRMKLWAPDPVKAKSKFW